ncbi:DUF456 domain-containing protein [Halobaculum sp. D14]|uniref:DUF456 domain-containing protein n=1 Tax=Halobaculum sp. D14 TaxID=3421642 RepID=UPI003EBE62DE
MVDLVTVLAVALLVAGVAGSVLPMLPAGALSLAGVYLYWFGDAPGGADEMSVWLLAGFTVVGVLTALLEHFGGALASKAGGASTSTMLVAAAASLLLFFVLGPLGVVVGTGVVVLGAELRAGKEFEEAMTASAWTVGGLLASAAAQFFLTLSMLVGFVAFVLVLH